MKTKYSEEDFIVEEVPLERDLTQKPAEESAYAYFLLEKKDWDTPRLVDEISRRLRINRKSIGYAGNKDRKAITKQRISIPLEAVPDVKEVEHLSINGCSFKFLGYAKERITLGDLKGNKFVITVRQIDEPFDVEAGKIRNYFGEQRFGKENINVALGKTIIKKEFDKTCSLLGKKAEGKNYVGALKDVDSRILRLYVNAYQSWLWNEVAKKVDTADVLELVGFLTEIKDVKVQELYEKLMVKDRIKKEDFLIKQFKEISSEGGTRKLYVQVMNLTSKWEKDEIFDGTYKCIVSFALEKGCYATEVVKALFE